MKRILTGTAFMLLAAGAAFVIAGGGAHAQQIQPPLVLQDGCKAITAAVTKTWNPTSPIVRASSPPPYGAPSCARYVADFEVGQLTPLGGHTTNFTIRPGLQWTNELLQASAADCATLIVDATIYRRGLRTTELVRIGGGRKRGQLQGSVCTLVAEASWVEPPLQTPPAAGTILIRVAESAKFRDAPIPVDIVLHRPY